MAHMTQAQILRTLAERTDFGGDDGLRDAVMAGVDELDPDTDSGSTGTDSGSTDTTGTTGTDSGSTGTDSGSTDTTGTDTTPIGTAAKAATTR